MAGRPLRPATDHRLGKPLPHQQANRPQASPGATCAFPLARVCGISTPFGALSPTTGQVPTCSSAVRHAFPEGKAFDLHALGTPPAFVLSQDQTLHAVGEAACRGRRAPTHRLKGDGTCHHHDSVVKVRSGPGHARANKKPGERRCARRAPGDVSGRGRSRRRGSREGVAGSELLRLPQLRCVRRRF